METGALVLAGADTTATAKMAMMIAVASKNFEGMIYLPSAIALGNSVISSAMLKMHPREPPCGGNVGGTM
jgi:hypothetical protein